MIATYAEDHRRALTENLAATDFVRAHIGHGDGGPFDGIPTTDAGVRVLCNVLRHLQRERNRLQRALYARNPWAPTPKGGRPWKSTRIS